jgi:hypothetical protein
MAAGRDPDDGRSYLATGRSDSLHDAAEQGWQRHDAAELQSRDGRLGVSLFADGGIYLWEPDPEGH